MGDDHTPPGMIRLTTEIDRLTGDGSKTPAPSALKPTRRRGATVSASDIFSDILIGKSDLQSAMKAVRVGQAAAEDARRREAETVDRRLRGWGALRHALATGTRRGWWWFFDFDGRTEAIPPHWWNSSAAEDAASHGVVTLMREIGPNKHSLKAIVIIEEEAPATEVSEIEPEPAEKAPAPFSHPKGKISQLIEFFRQYGLTKFDGLPKSRLKIEAENAGIASLEKEFEAAYLYSVENGYLRRLEGAPRVGQRKKDG